MNENLRSTHSESDSAIMSQVLKLIATDNSPSLGAMVEEKRNSLNLSTKAASEVLIMTRSSYERLVTGELQKLDVATIYKIANFLGTRTDEVLKYFAASSMPAQDFKEIEESKERVFIANNFDLPRLRKIGFINSIDNHGHVRDRIIQYFSLDSLYEYGTDIAAVLFRKAKTTVEDKMMSFWILSAIKQFQSINNPNPFDADRVQKLATQMRIYTRDKKYGLLKVMRALYDSGITVITQRALPNTSVHGGTFIVNKKPCIVITDHFKSYPLLWITLLHELGHVVFHLQKLDVMKYHISDGVEDLFLIESQADKFAYQLLLKRDKFEYIKNYINIESFVNTYAEQNSIDPSIIYYMYAKELSDEKDNSGWKYFGRYMPSSDVCSDQINTPSWLSVSIVKEAEKSKALLASSSLTKS